MKKLSAKIIVILLLILSFSGFAEVGSCPLEIAKNTQTVEKTNSQLIKEELTTKTSHVKATKKPKNKSSNLGMFKLLIPDMSPNN